MIDSTLNRSLLNLEVKSSQKLDYQCRCLEHSCSQYVPSFFAFSKSELIYRSAYSGSHGHPTEPTGYHPLSQVHFSELESLGCMSTPSSFVDADY
jgi:hypothetical protein